MSAVKEMKGGRGRRKREGRGWYKGGQGAAASKGGSVYSLFLSSLCINIFTKIKITGIISLNIS